MAIYEAIECCLQRILFFLLFRLSPWPLKTNYSAIALYVKSKVVFNHRGKCSRGFFLVPKNLDVVLDHRLDFSAHIPSTNTTGRLFLSNARAVPSLENHANQPLLQSSVTSHLSYYNALLAGLLACTTKVLNSQTWRHELLISTLMLRSQVCFTFFSAPVAVGIEHFIFIMDWAFEGELNPF